MQSPWRIAPPFLCMSPRKRLVDRRCFCTTLLHTPFPGLEKDSFFFPEVGLQLCIGSVLSYQLSFLIWSPVHATEYLFGNEFVSVWYRHEPVSPPSSGDGCKLQEVLECASRFSSRVPDKMVSMAKLQAYLMKQKLMAEQEMAKKKEMRY